ncbi:transcriptional regulator [Pochonia chlamydosporia 170]|uniref:Transcriptional regulator n=1 Tax=Pochonia chlamydosporia 170 TaxID=1380566 RepID=A0A179FDU7_METCM|nr:transcriptional regulator [Pochonia chlamydosporia 170]OAQ63656.1 transcriptional regulator [Pochonia chlamydosporia 170]
MDTIHKMGNYSFRWTDLHLSRATTDPLRYEYDVLGSRTVTKLQGIEQANAGLSQDGKKRLDMYTLLRENWKTDEVITSFWEEVHTVPSWVDWAQLERGQKFFYRYATANLMGFALQGFMGENSSASGVVEVLVRTGGFSTRVLPRRLLETFQFILQVTKSVGDIKPGGNAHTAAIRVRLLHSAVRERILSLAGSRSDYYDVEKHGIPLNTLDSIHSISTFCCNHMWLQLPFMGVYPQKQEIQDYIALWRYIGYLLGTPTSYFSSVPRAKATMESMLLHERVLSPTSFVVAYNFVQSIRDLAPMNISTGFIEAGSRVLNGDQFCDSLGLGRPGLMHYACFQGHCWLVQFLAVVQRLIPRFDHAVVEYSKKMLHRGIIERGLGGESKFNFKYVPRVGKLTGTEGSVKTMQMGFFNRPLESVYFFVFLIECLLIAGTAFLAVYGVHRFLI